MVVERLHNTTSASHTERVLASSALAQGRWVHTGLAGALSMLKGRGELEQPVEWAGRVNDMKTDRILGMGEVYTGGRNEDKLARDIENALTERDEWGRILTPRERFRRQCYECVPFSAVRVPSCWLGYCWDFNQQGWKQRDVTRC